MSTVIRNNLSALRTYNIMATNHAQAQKHQSRVATGMKIIGPQDDGSAYSISERMRVRIRALGQAHQNTQNGSSMIKTAEGAVANILETLRTLKEKAVDAANDSNTDEDRRIIQKEFDALVDQIDDDALTQFNTKYLINGTHNNALRTTQSVFFNDNLSLDTTSSTKFYELKNRNGESLGIKDTDTIAWSYINNTEGTYHGELKATDTFSGNTLNDSFIEVFGYSDVGELYNIRTQTPRFYYHDKFNANHDILPGTTMLSVEASNGSFYAFSGFSFRVLDSEGNVNKYATAQLQFTEIQRAEAPTGDNALSFHVGADANQATKIALTNMNSRALGLKYSWTEDPDEKIIAPQAISISTKDDANIAIDAIDRAIQRVLDEQSNIGAALSRLNYTAENLTTSFTNDQTTESVIRDADMATEMSGYLRYNVLSRASQAMLAQANHNPMDVISLLYT